MNRETKSDITRRIERLEATPSKMEPREAETLLMEILSPLLAEDGYTVTRTRKRPDSGFDFVAKRAPTDHYQSNTIGIQQKHRSNPRPVQLHDFGGFLFRATGLGLDRVMIVSNIRFSRGAREAARRFSPVQVELMDIDSLKAWVERIEIDISIDRLEIEQILRTVSRRFAQLIAEDPHNLDKLEWRDMERILAEVFDGIGFSVELTPGSNDQGKDIILECVISGSRRTYVVEIKHWRSGNRVGQPKVRDFLNVIIHEGREGGLFLSTYGYCNNAFEMLSEIERQRLRFGDKEKIIGLCNTYLKSCSGIWSPPESLAELLFEGTT